jgi:predicted nucleic acid-binding protein
MKKLVFDGPMAVDTCVFIYFIESDPEWLPVVQPIFASAGGNGVSLVTSSLTLHEVLVIPYRAGDLALAARYEALLTRSRGLAMIEMGRPIVRAAAQLRATYGLKMGDSFQVATALAARCTSFVTNDRKIADIPGLRIVQLSELG